MEKPIAIFPSSTNGLEKIMGSLTERQKANIVHVQSIGYPISVDDIKRAQRVMFGEVLIVIGDVRLETLLASIDEERAIWYKSIHPRDGAEQWFTIEFWDHRHGNYVPAVFKQNEGFTLRQMGY